MPFSFRYFRILRPIDVKSTRIHLTVSNIFYLIVYMKNRFSYTYYTEVYTTDSDKFELYLFILVGVIFIDCIQNIRCILIHFPRLLLENINCFLDRIRIRHAH